MTSPIIIPLNSREANLKRKVRAHLKKIGFGKAPDGTLIPPALDKETYRNIHSHQRLDKIKKHKDWVATKSEKLIQYFASGTDINVHTIHPRLELISAGTWRSDLFRFAGLYWQIPISEGFGRRLRFLVWDDANEKLIGLLALGDAVFNLRARDQLVGWDHKRRSDALVNLMDAYVLGAVPPYNKLLGGKLIASLVRTSNIVDAFEKKYLKSVGIISHKQKKAQLVAVTTSSALGRSSIYNRLKLNGKSIFEPIGYTSGFGHFHISDELFEELRDYLKYINDSYANGFNFGQGPNWRLRVIRRSIGLLGMNPDMLRHGFAREVFFCSLASNAINFLRGEHEEAQYESLPSVETAGLQALSRWVIPRAQRMPDYITWRAEQFLEDITLEKNQIGLQLEDSIWTGRETL